VARNLQSEMVADLPPLPCEGMGLGSPRPRGADPWVVLALAVARQAARDLNGKCAAERAEANAFFSERGGVFESLCGTLDVGIEEGRVAVFRSVERQRRRREPRHGDGAARTGRGA